MTTKSSFTDKERAAWHDVRRTKPQRDTNAGNFSASGNTCIHCGNPLGRDIPDGYEAALCGAYD